MTNTANPRYPADIYLFKVCNRNTIKRCDICSKLTIKTPKRRQLRYSGASIVNFGHILHIYLVFLLFILNRYFEQLNVCWGNTYLKSA